MTELVTTILIKDIRKVEKGNLVGTLFLDLSHAFGTVSHAALLMKLNAYVVDNNELEWFKSYLFHRAKQIKIDDILLDENPLFSGVLQGSFLGPLLFLIFYNDLTDYICHSKILQYADDMVLYYTNNEVSSVENSLNDDLKCISNFCYDNELILNLKKSKMEVEHPKNFESIEIYSYFIGIK